MDRVFVEDPVRVLAFEAGRCAKPRRGDPGYLFGWYPLSAFLFGLAAGVLFGGWGLLLVLSLLGVVG